HRGRFLGFLVDHHGHSDAAVGVASAAQLSPISRGSVNQVGEVGEGAHEGNGEPVSNGLADSGLILYVVGQMGKRIALRGAPVVGDRFVAPGERYRLERTERNLLRIVE